MRYEIHPVLHAELVGTVVGTILCLETPTHEDAAVAAELDSVQQHFHECASSLVQSHQEHEHGIFGFEVVLRSSEGLAPPSCYLDSLCRFLRETPFVVEGGSDPHAPLQLVIHVDPAALTEDEDDEDAVLVDATNLICTAFWQNDMIRTVYYVAMNVPFVPSQDVIYRTVAAGGSNGYDNFHVDDDDDHDVPIIAPTGACVTLLCSDVRNRDGLAGEDLVQVQVECAAVAALSAAHAQDLMDRVLHLFRPDVGGGRAGGGVVGRPPRRAKVFATSDSVAAAVAARIHADRGQHTTMKALHLVRGIRSGPGLLRSIDAYDQAVFPPVDGTDLFRAVVSSGTVINLGLEGFRLSGPLTTSMGGIDEINAPEPTRLRSLAFRKCTFPDDPVRGVGAFAVSVLRQSPALWYLDLFGTPMSLVAMTTLCRELADSRMSSFRELRIGTAPVHDNPCLDDAAVEYFFRMLPTIKRLRNVQLRHVIPVHMFRVAVDGVRNNYWLHGLLCMKFEEADEEDGRDGRKILPSPDLEMQSYMHANEYNRAAVYDAVVALQDATKSPCGGGGDSDNDNENDDTPQILMSKVAAALRVLELLSTSDERLSIFTSRYICVRLLLPAALGGGGSKGHGSRHDHRSGRSRNPA